MTGIDRRSFLALLAAIPLQLRAAKVQPDGVIAPQRLLSACQEKDDSYHFLAVDYQRSETGQHRARELFRHRLPARAHQVLVNQDASQVCVIERRPGKRFDVLDLHKGTLQHRVSCEDGYHLYGHAQYSADGRFLITAEQKSGVDNGVLVFRDANDPIKIIKRLDSGGVGPHEFRLLNDNTLVVANGGIRTRGREKLNLDIMQPNLAYIDLISGRILETHQMDSRFHQCSIRHIALNPQGQVLVAMQFEGERSVLAPLIALHQRGQALQPLAMPQDLHVKLNHYTGSACIDSSGRFAAVSAPRGNRIVCFDLDSQICLGAVTVSDGCGLAPTTEEGGFFVSSGRGRLYRVSAISMKKTRLDAILTKDVRWDNHLSVA